MGRRARVWEIRDDYRPLLKRVKKLFPTLLAHVKTKRVALVGFHNKSSRHVARIYKNGYPWSMLVQDYDYLISFWSSRFDGEKKSYRLFVMLHELLHIPEGGFDEGDPNYRRLIDHDIEDFKALRVVYGIHLDRIIDIYKGEKELIRDHEKIKRFPRLVKIV